MSKKQTFKGTKIQVNFMGIIIMYKTHRSVQFGNKENKSVSRSMKSNRLEQMSACN